MRTLITATQNHRFHLLLGGNASLKGQKYKWFHHFFSTAAPLVSLKGNPQNKTSAKQSANHQKHFALMSHLETAEEVQQESSNFRGIKWREFIKDSSVQHTKMRPTSRAHNSAVITKDWLADPQSQQCYERKVNLGQFERSSTHHTQLPPSVSSLPAGNGPTVQLNLISCFPSCRWPWREGISCKAGCW